MQQDQQKKIQEQNERIEKNLKKIKNRIVVFSGKGGVGKSTVAVNLSYALLANKNKVGLLDADITGPNVPQMVGITGKPQAMDEHKILPQIKEGLRVISIAPMVPKDQPVIWRGPLRAGTINQFIGDVVWENLDYLISDLPPGTGDEVLTASQKLKPKMAIVVTTPQEVSLLDCRRAVNMAKKLEIPNIGVVENMAGLICPHCGKEIDFFGTGGGKKMAEQMRETGISLYGKLSEYLPDVAARYEQGAKSAQHIVQAKATGKSPAELYQKTKNGVQPEEPQVTGIGEGEEGSPFALEMDDFPDQTDELFAALEKLVPDFGHEVPEAVRAGNTQINMKKKARKAKYLAAQFEKAKFALEAQRDYGQIIFSTTKAVQAMPKVLGIQYTGTKLSAKPNKRVLNYYRSAKEEDSVKGEKPQKGGGGFDRRS